MLDSDAEGAPDSLRATVSQIPPPPEPPPSTPRSARARARKGWLGRVASRPIGRSIAVALGCGLLASSAAPVARRLNVPAFWLAAALHTPAEANDTPPPPAAPAQPSWWSRLRGDKAAPERADAKLVREGRSPLGAGLLTIPPSFTSADGAYDLVIHFHGNTDLVEDSFGVAKVNAVVVIVNLGVGSGVYEDRFASPDELRETLARVQRTLVKRGLEGAHLRRLALSSWSAGYGAILRIVENPATADLVDSVVLLDGIHARLLPEGEPNAGGIDPLRIEPFLRFARRAVAGDKLFVITHSDVKPTEYAGCRDTTDAMLSRLDVTRHPGGEAPSMPPLASTHGVPKSKLVPLEPRSEAHAGGLWVRGFGGETPEHHMAHLVMMASVGLPELAKRLGEPSAAATPAATPPR